MRIVPSNVSDNCSTWRAPQMGCRKKKLSYYSSVNGSADCVEIWYVFRNPLGTVYPIVTGGVSLHVRTCTPPSLYLRNGLADRVQICCVVCSPLVKKFSHVMGDISHSSLHVRTCTPRISISGTTWTIALKFIVHLGTN